jgi:hypothetical protein
MPFLIAWLDGHSCPARKRVHACIPHWIWNAKRRGKKTGKDRKETASICGDCCVLVERQGIRRLDRRGCPGLCCIAQVKNQRSVSPAVEACRAYSPFLLPSMNLAVGYRSQNTKAASAIYCILLFSLVLKIQRKELSKDSQIIEFDNARPN